MKIFSAVLPVLFLVSAAFAGESALHLKNGGVVRGRLEKTESGQIRCHLKKGYVDFEWSEIERVVGNPVPTVRLNSAYEEQIQRAARRYHLDPNLIRAIIQVESSFDPLSLSHKGALGLMQLMPETAEGLGVSNPLDPWQSIDGGSRYFTYMLDRFRGDVTKALAAYNAGPRPVLWYGGVPPYAETQDYVRSVLRIYQRYKKGTPLFTYSGKDGETVLTNVLQ